MPVTVALSLLAALLFAVSAAMQQRAAREAARRRTADRAASRSWLPVLGVLSRLVRDRRWLAGWLANVAGFGTHATALHAGSITVVQSLLMVQLLVALALGPHRPMCRDWLGTLAVCAGLAILVTVHSGVARAPARRVDVALVALVAAALIAGLITVARVARPRPQVRSALVGVAAGACFCLTAVFVVVVTDDLSRGGLGAVASDWATLGLAASTSLGGLLVQDAFASGSLPTALTALTAMTIADPLCSTVAGMSLWDAGPTPGPGTLIAYTVVAVLVTAGVVLLANSPTLHDERAPLARPADRWPARAPLLGRWRGRRRSVAQGLVPGEEAGDRRRPGEPLGRGARGRASLGGGQRDELADAVGEAVGGAVGDPA
jgi:hypothetical protein